MAVNIESAFRSLPDVNSKDFLPAVKEIIEVAIGQRGEDDNRFVTLADLTDVALIKHLGEQPISIINPPDPIVTPGTLRVPPPRDLRLVVDEDAGRINAFHHHLIWTNATPADIFIAHTEVWVNAGSNSRSGAVLKGIVTYPGNEYLYPTPNPTLNYFYWIRHVAWNGDYSPWEPNESQGGFIVLGDDTIGDTVDKLMDALKGETPDAYSHGTSYTTGQHVSYAGGDGKTRTYEAVSNSTNQYPCTGNPPSTNSTYWKRSGILVIGEVDGDALVGIDGNMVVDGTIVARNIATGTLTADLIAAGAITADLIQVGAVSWETHVTGPNKPDDNADETRYHLAADTAAVGGINADVFAGWKSDDGPYIDGGKIYAGSITANSFESTLYGNLNQAFFFVNTILGAAAEYEQQLTSGMISSATKLNIDTLDHLDYQHYGSGYSLRINTIDYWDDGSTHWDYSNTYYDIPTALSASFTSGILDLGSIKTIQMGYQYRLLEDVPSDTTVTVYFQYSNSSTGPFGTNEPDYTDGLWETAQAVAVSNEQHRAHGEVHQFRYFKFKIILLSADADSRIILYENIVSGNIVNIYGYKTNETIAIGGTNFTVAGYNSVPAVTATCVNGVGICKITNKTTTGFTVTIYDAAASDVGGTADIIVMGA